MRKSNKLKGFIFKLAFFLLLSCCYIYVAKYSPFTGTLRKLFYTLAFEIIGLIIMYFVHNIIHELSHALFAIFGGGKITALSFWGFTFDFVKGGIKFSFINSVAGWTAFVVKDTQKAKTAYKLSLLGGFISSLSLVVAGFIIPFFISGDASFYFASILGLGNFATLYMFAVNFLLFEPSTDGFNLFSFSKESKIKVNNDIRTLQYESSLYYGKSLNEIENSSLINGLSYYDMLKEIYNNNLNSALIIGDNILDKHFDDGVAIAVNIEQLFISLLSEDGWEITSLYDQLSDIIEEADTLQKIRVAYLYHKVNDDVEWCDALKQTFYKLLDSESKGLAQSEKEIFEHFCL